MRHQLAYYFDTGDGTWKAICTCEWETWGHADKGAAITAWREHATKSVQRDQPSAEGFARGIAASLAPGKHGAPKIVQRFRNVEANRAGFVVENAQGEERYEVTVQALPKGAPNGDGKAAA